MGQGRPLPIEMTQASRNAELRRRAGRAVRSLLPSNPYDIATCLLLTAIAAIALFTFRDYAISNDEGVQHHYGELIIAYYRSGFADRDLFTYQNLYLYGGLFDVIAVGLARIIPIDPYTLRHILCAITGIGGSAAGCGSARGPDRGARLEPVRRLVWRDVQPHQGHSLCRCDDGRDLLSRPSGARAAVAAHARCHCVRPAHRCSAWRAQPRAVAFRVSRACHCDPTAVAGARRASAVCDDGCAENLSGGGAGLAHHDRRLALGRAVAAQPDPRIVCLLRVSLRHPHRVRGTYLRDG